MATLIETPMLSVNAGKLGKVDPCNVGSVTKIWSVVSKSNQAECLGDGPRLENMLWRTLSRQALCNNPTSLRSIATSTIHTSATRPRRKDVPDLSTSTSTLASDASAQASSPDCASDLTISPPQHHQQPDSPILSSSKGSEICLRPLDLEKMVSSIQEKQQIEPLSPTINNAVSTTLSYTDASTETTVEVSSPTHINAPHHSSDSSCSTAPTNDSDSERSTRPSISSDTSAELPPVVRGFSPSQAPSSYRSTSHLVPEALGKSPLSQHVPRSKPDVSQKGGGFFVGGSSGEEESSFDDRMSSQPKQSSLTAALKPKKELSFKDIVESRKLNEKSHEDEEVFESDDEDEEDEEEEEDDSAIDESEDEGEDDEAWEDDAEEETDNNDKPLFKRVDSQSNLVSRRSLLTTMMNQNDRAAAFQEQAVKANPGLRRSKTSNNVPTEETATSTELLRTPAKPIMRVKSEIMSLVSSPKTTRRNMLSTEIDEGLRKSILHERLQKKATVSAYTKRVQSARNLTTLSQQISPDDLRGKGGEVGSGETDDPYGHGIGGYHQTGW